MHEEVQQKTPVDLTLEPPGEQSVTRKKKQ